MRIVSLGRGFNSSVIDSPPPLNCWSFMSTSFRQHSLKCNNNMLIAVTLINSRAFVAAKALLQQTILITHLRQQTPQTTLYCLLVVPRPLVHRHLPLTKQPNINGSQPFTSPWKNNKHKQPLGSASSQGIKRVMTLSSPNWRCF